MWLFTRNGFLSVIQDPNESHHLFIRARVRGDLERLVAELDKPVDIVERPGRDYLWAVTVHRADFIKVMVDQLMELDYTNVKDAIDLGEKARHDAMLRVWTTMSSLQVRPPYSSGTVDRLDDRREYRRWWADAETDLEDEYDPDDYLMSLSDPSDFVSVEPEPRGKYRVVIWTVDGDPRTVKEHLSRFEADALARVVRDTVSTWTEGFRPMSENDDEVRRG